MPIYKWNGMYRFSDPPYSFRLVKDMVIKPLICSTIFLDINYESGNIDNMNQTYEIQYGILWLAVADALKYREINKEFVGGDYINILKQLEHELAIRNPVNIVEDS